MSKSRNSSKIQDSRALVNTSPPKALQLSKELHTLTKLEETRQEIQSNMEQIDNYVLFLESVLKDKLTPTHDVQDLNRRLRHAKREINRLRSDIEAIEEYLDSYTHDTLPPVDSLDVEVLGDGSSGG